MGGEGLNFGKFKPLPSISSLILGLTQFIHGTSYTHLGTNNRQLCVFQLPFSVGSAVLSLGMRSGSNCFLADSGILFVREPKPITFG